MSPQILKHIMAVAERHHADTSRMMMESPDLAWHLVPNLVELAKLNRYAAQRLTKVDGVL